MIFLSRSGLSAAAPSTTDLGTASVDNSRCLFFLRLLAGSEPGVERVALLLALLALVSFPFLFNLDLITLSFGVGNFLTEDAKAAEDVEGVHVASRSILRLFSSSSSSSTAASEAFSLFFCGSPLFPPSPSPSSSELQSLHSASESSTLPMFFSLSSSSIFWQRRRIHLGAYFTIFREIMNLAPNFRNCSSTEFPCYAFAILWTPHSRVARYKKMTKNDADIICHWKETYDYFILHYRILVPMASSFMSLIIMTFPPLETQHNC